jgi:predicted acetyltransferase
MGIEIERADAEHETILANLLQLYAHDFSEFYDVDLGPDGRFVYKELPLYFSESNRHAFLVRKDGMWAGFILMRRGSQISGADDVWDVAEFFVLRGCRRRGVGTEIARRIWSRFPGKWEVRVMEGNRSAHRFWERAIALFVGREIAPVAVQKNGEAWRVYSFDSAEASGQT